MEKGEIMTSHLQIIESSKFKLVALIKKLLSYKLVPTLITGFEQLSLFTKDETERQLVTQMNFDHLNKLMILYLRNESALKFYEQMMSDLMKHKYDLPSLDVFIPLAASLQRLDRECILKKTTQIQLVSNINDRQIQDVKYDNGYQSDSCLQKIKSLINQNKIDYQILYNFNFKIGQELEQTQQEVEQQGSLQFKEMSVIKISEKFEFSSNSTKNLTNQFSVQSLTMLFNIKFKDLLNFYMFLKLCYPKDISKMLHFNLILALKNSSVILTQLTNSTLFIINQPACLTLLLNVMILYQSPRQTYCRV